MTLELSTIKQLISEELDFIEADRFIKSLEQHIPDTQLTFSDVFCAFQAMLEKDMNSCVESGFIKLDIFGEQTVDRDLIKNAILSLIR